MRKTFLREYNAAKRQAWTTVRLLLANNCDIEDAIFGNDFYWFRYSLGTLRYVSIVEDLELEFTERVWN